MIRIKDYIFNENEIKSMDEDKNAKQIHIHFADDVHIWVKATFDDIEWNYGNNISESLSYDLAKARIEELEEEKKKLKDELKALKGE